ncbi:hypothetical protein [Mycolicibacterium fortuitum]|uniref:hypothetical protein n=1 Tax=Mycolicibacterium fortuitum TaxID=1766 RepID=UPI003AAF4F1E
MAMEGADVEQLRALATQLAKGADRLATTASTLHSLVNSNTHWRGADAERFRSEWNGGSAGALKTAAEKLREADKLLRRNADEQDNASNGKQAGAAEMFHRLENDQTNDYGESTGDTDGVRIESVVGPDGKTRLIVYLKGQDTVDGRSGLRSAGLATGVVGVDANVTRQIDEALAKLPDGKKTEVMLVGHSQGGMDAQNIASSGKYNVTTLMTYGTPVIQADDPKIATVHIRAEGDPVPVAGETAAAVAHGGGNPIAVAAHAMAPRSDNVFTYDTPNDGVAMSVHENGYPGAAAGFDKSTDGRFTDVKENMKKFEGTVTVVTE